MVFIAVPRLDVRLAALVLAGASDLADGWLARRLGGSRIGVVLDPIADKLFMLAAFAVVFFSGRLEWYEVLAVLLRDLIATVAVILTFGAHRVTTVPARLGGKAVTLLQLLTLLAFLLDSSHLQELAWATGAVALYALWDYNRFFFRKLSRGKS